MKKPGDLVKAMADLPVIEELISSDNVNTR